MLNLHIAFINSVHLLLVDITLNTYVTKIHTYCILFIYQFECLKGRLKKEKSIYLVKVFFGLFQKKEQEVTSMSTQA